MEELRHIRFYDKSLPSASSYSLQVVWQIEANSNTYGTRKFNFTFTRALLSLIKKVPVLIPWYTIDGRTILERTLKSYVSMWGIGLIRLRIGIIEEPL